MTEEEGQGVELKTEYLIVIFAFVALFLLLGLRYTLIVGLLTVVAFGFYNYRRRKLKPQP